MSCLCYIYVTSTLRLWGRHQTKEFPRARLVGWILKPQMTCHGYHLTSPLTYDLDPWCIQNCHHVWCTSLIITIQLQCWWTRNTKSGSEIIIQWILIVRFFSSMTLWKDEKSPDSVEMISLRNRFTHVLWGFTSIPTYQVGSQASKLQLKQPMPQQILALDQVSLSTMPAEWSCHQTILETMLIT